MDILINNCRYGCWGTEGGLHFSKGSIAISGGTILALGKKPEAFHPEKVIEASGRLALPGLVNSHTHVSMSLLRNLADDRELMDWLEHAVWPMEAKMGPEEIHLGARLSMIELIRSGVTAFADMYFHMDQVAEAALEAGIRANVGAGLTGEGGAIGEKLEAFRELHRNYNGAGDGLITVDLAPHAPYTCDRGCLEEAAALANELDCGLHIHLSETAGEVAQCREKHGISPVALAEQCGIFSRRTIAAHCVHVDEADMDILKQNHVHVVHNPSSNLKLASGFAPVGRMLEKGVSLAIGTDGPASNNNQDMVEELHLAAILAKAAARNPKALPAWQAISLATRGGAETLGLPEGSGSLQEGAPADIILMDSSGAHMQPLYDPAAAIAYSASSSDVVTLLCRGRVVMEERNILTLDEEAIIREAAKAGRRLQG